MALERCGLDLRDLIMTGDKVSEMLQAFRSFIGENQMMAYLVMMAVRLKELHRVLKLTGSLYLHCDPTAVERLMKIIFRVYAKAFCPLTGNQWLYYVFWAW